METCVWSVDRYQFTVASCVLQVNRGKSINAYDLPNFTELQWKES